MFLPIKALLPKSIDRRGLKRTFDAAHVCEVTRKILKAAFGEDVGDWVRPLSFKNNSLYLETQSSGWAQRVHRQKHLLLRNLQSHLPALSIRAVVVRRTSLRAHFVDNMPLSA